MSTPTIKIRATVIPPGGIFVHKLSVLTSFAQKKELDIGEWGICEHNNRYWVGYGGTVEGQTVLRVSLQEIKNRRAEEYPERKDEELFVLAGREGKSNEFKWLLLNSEQMEEGARRLEHQRMSALKGEEASENAVIHQVSLADLICLAELWEVSSDNLGIEIAPDDTLVPKIITEEDEMANLTQVQALADKSLPDTDPLDIVIEYESTDTGSKLRVLTMDYVCSPEGKKRKTKWWSFTDTYKELMDS